MELTRIVTSAVDLESYSSSAGYLGYFERRAAFSVDLCDRAVERLLASEPFRGPLRIASSLFAETESVAARYGAGEVGLRERIEPLVRAGVIPGLASSAADDPDDPDGVSGAIRGRLDGSLLGEVGPLDERDQRSLLSAVMLLGSARGHLFVFREEAGLLAYPHDDTGFGFVDTSGDDARRVDLRERLAREFDGEEFVFREKSSM